MNGSASTAPRGGRGGNGHTPGPWKADLQEFGEGATEIVGICPVVRMNGACDAVVVSLGADNVECQANARLIAAAPQLLHALERVVSAFEMVEAGTTHHEKTNRSFLDLRAFMELGGEVIAARAALAAAAPAQERGE
jgi:hypothetical protein